LGFVNFEAPHIASELSIDCALKQPDSKIISAVAKERRYAMWLLLKLCKVLPGKFLSGN
jgi:hypothetical protein